MSRTCARCERPQSDAAQICHSCTRDLKRTLAAITDLWPNLQQAIGKQTAMGQRTEGKATKRDAQPLPVDLRASDVADHARATITGWVRVLAEDNRLTMSADTIPAMCTFLIEHRNDLRRHDAAVDMCDELTYTSGQIHRVVDYRDDRSRILVGPCIETNDSGESCPGEIHAIIPERDGGTPRMECRACGGIWDATQWARMGARVQRRKDQQQLQKSYGKDPVMESITKAKAAAQRRALRMRQIEQREPCDDCGWVYAIAGDVEYARPVRFCEKHGGEQ